ncbi:antibiotic biosynthesis monooxygenase [Amycolatopsis balhimycina DSM 5908]|uniref:Antibiotic biosynthesis monooxygenase n=1 Tax=Amycolatopsis balhimycina DSM 5908 TaxID=1081091 RepID=A0A428WPA2_AMYBA|nr:antibiotic biosynthesis monooxygenase [Amycolatopsis balhimycina]RSM44884.1 antibiotic biosynthesis monooxygenase [Amycolatopsis balhimycina DSM 5908]
MAGGTVRVLIYAVADEDGVGRAYHEISAALRGTPGLLGNELLREFGNDDGGFAVMSEWVDRDAFQAWEQGPGHRDVTAPLRPYQDTGRGRPFGLYEVVARY